MFKIIGLIFFVAGIILLLITVGVLSSASKCVTDCSGYGYFAAFGGGLAMTSFFAGLAAFIIHLIIQAINKQRKDKKDLE